MNGWKGRYGYEGKVKYQSVLVVIIMLRIVSYLTSY